MRADFLKMLNCLKLSTFINPTRFKLWTPAQEIGQSLKSRKAGKDLHCGSSMGPDICANTSCCCSYFSLRPSRASNVFLLHMLFLVPQISSSSSEEFSTFEAALMFCYALRRMFVFSSTGMMMLPSFVLLTQFGSFATF